MVGGHTFQLQVDKHGKYQNGTHRRQGGWPLHSGKQGYWTLTNTVITKELVSRQAPVRKQNNSNSCWKVRKRDWFRLTAAQAQLQAQGPESIFQCKWIKQEVLNCMEAAKMSWACPFPQAFKDEHSWDSLALWFCCVCTCLFLLGRCISFHLARWPSYWWQDSARAPLPTALLPSPPAHPFPLTGPPHSLIRLCIPAKGAVERASRSSSVFLTSRVTRGVFQPPICSFSFLLFHLGLPNVRYWWSQGAHKINWPVNFVK